MDRCCGSPELLRRAVLSVAFGVEAIQHLQQEQLRLGRRGGGSGERSGFLQIAVFHLKQEQIKLVWATR